MLIETYFNYNNLPKETSKMLFGRSFEGEPICVYVSEFFYGSEFGYINGIHSILEFNCN